jgi:ribulose-phosphate 3-epimerase
LKGLFDVIKKKLPSEDSLLYTEVGVALNIDTPNEQIYPLIPVVDFVQFMGIAKIGFQGEPFDERVLAKIADLRGKYPNATISIDGGVNKENAVALVKAGVNRLVVGSALFGSENISEELMNFQSLII